MIGDEDVILEEAFKAVATRGAMLGKFPEIDLHGGNYDVFFECFECFVAANDVTEYKKLQQGMQKYEHCSGAPQFLTFLLLLVLTFEATPCAGLREGPTPGGWMKQDPNNATFVEAAQFAERKVALIGGPRYRILQVLSAWTQDVNGTNFRVLYVRGPKCRPDEDLTICDENEPPENCLAIVYASQYNSQRNLIMHSCSQQGGGGRFPPEEQTLSP
ncbi:L-cystatin-like [Dermacentor silvarum]|uniref:L-cystatin-like n=1 Tax=Dermacentor silvarum TaxID=543639 RepID=UPI002100F4CD|nr:L-cystatin-like [Dermacentor silvarum]